MTLIVNNENQYPNDLVLLSFAAVEGISIDGVASASEKIQEIIDEVSCLSMQSLNLNISMAILTSFFHFVSFKCIMSVVVTRYYFIVTKVHIFSCV